MPTKEKAMTDKPTTEERTVFALGHPARSGDPVTIVIGVSKAAWNYMKDGNTHTVDLRKGGINVQFMLFGGDTMESCIEVLKDAAGGHIPPMDKRDFSIKPKLDS
jgi:hypothetical protein